MSDANDTSDTQQNHNAETDEDTASGGAAQDPASEVLNDDDQKTGQTQTDGAN